MDNLEIRKILFKDEFFESMESDFSDTKFLENILKTLFNNKIDLKELSEILDQPMDEEGNRALHIVSAKGNQELAKLFVQYGAQIDIKNNLGKTPLDIAKVEKVTAIGKALNALTFGYTDYRDTTQVQDTIKSITKTVTKLQSMGRRKQDKIDLSSVKAAKIVFAKALEDNPLNYNRIKGTIQAIHDQFGKERLGAILNSSIDGGGNTALHIAAIEGDVDLAKILVKNGARLDPKNKKGNTPEIEAIKHQRSVFDELSDAPDTDQVREYIVDGGRDNKGALNFVNREGALKCVEELVANNNPEVRKGDVVKDYLLKLQEISKTEEFQKNPLEYLGSANLEELEKILHGQKDKSNPLYQPKASGWVNYYDHDGYIQKAIDSAKEILQVTQDFQEQVKRTVVLEEFKKDLESSDMSRIDESLQRMGPEMSYYVLSQPMDEKGNTSLHLAALKGDKKLAEVLVVNGASLTSENKDGDIPEKVALKNQRTFIGRLANYPDTEPTRDYLSDADKIKRSKLGKEIRGLSKTPIARANKIMPTKPSKARQ